jgi:hypothetical protein
MPTKPDVLNLLRKNREIELSVKGRVTGKVSSRPVWFAFSKDSRSIYLIPVNGRKTQWYLNVKKEPQVTIGIGGTSFTGRLVELGAERFQEALEAFEGRYGERDMKEYYPRLEVALEMSLDKLPS